MYTSDMRLADIGTRFLAALIDSLATAVPYTILVIGGQGQEASLLTLLGFLLLLALVGVQIYLLTVSGQTIGKKALNIKIVKADTGENGGFVTNFLLRSLVNALIGIVPLYGLVDVLFIFRDDRRCVHDLLAGTVVIKA